jgi:hypothetical protein
MGSIHLSNSKGRDAMVATRHIVPSLRLRWLDGAGRQAQNVRVLCAPIDCELPALLERQGGTDGISKIADALISGDPEIDLERTGSYLRDTSRVYVGPDRKLVSAISEWDLVHGSDGALRERRPAQVAEQNVATEVPLRWSGRLMKKAEVWNRFAFTAKLQIVHVNGLTYDFLFEIARELEQKDSLLFVGGGAKGNQPLYFQRGGTPYRGFLEGRTRGESYCLLLHLANLELKTPSPADAVGK